MMMMMKVGHCSDSGRPDVTAKSHRSRSAITPITEDAVQAGDAAVLHASASSLEAGLSPSEAKTTPQCTAGVDSSV